MSPIDKTPSGGPLEPSRRQEALGKLAKQREQLQKTPLPDPVKQVRDAFLIRTRTDPDSWSISLGDLGGIKLPFPIEARPKYGLSPVPLPSPPWGQDPRPIEVRPKYGLSPVPLPDRPIEIRPMYGLSPIRWPEPPEDKLPFPIEVRPKYGLSSIPQEP